MKRLLLLVSTMALIVSGALWAQTPGQTSPGSQAHMQGQSWSGKLVDASCHERDPKASCPISATTTSYGIVTSDGSFYKLDSNGNSQVSKELEQKTTKTGSMNATVTGSLQGDTINVQSVQIQ